METEITGKSIRIKASPGFEDIAKALVIDLDSEPTWHRRDTGEFERAGGDLVSFDIQQAVNLYNLTLAAFGIYGGVIVKKLAEDTYAKIKSFIGKSVRSHAEKPSQYGRTGVWMRFERIESLSVTDRINTDNESIRLRIFMNNETVFDEVELGALLDSIGDASNGVYLAGTTKRLYIDVDLKEKQVTVADLENGRQRSVDK